MCVSFSVEIIGDSMETNLEESITSYPSVDHLVTEVHPSNMEVNFVLHSSNFYCTKNSLVMKC